MGKQRKQCQTLFWGAPKSQQMVIAAIKLKDACYWKKSYDQPRQHTLPTKVCLVKAMVFPVVMYGCEIWTVRRDEHRRIDAFELCCWRRLLRVPWAMDSWESPTSPCWRKSVLNIHWKDWCWSWNSNTLAFWCEELTSWKRPWCWERLKARGKGEDFCRE